MFAKLVEVELLSLVVGEGGEGAPREEEERDALPGLSTTRAATFAAVEVAVVVEPFFCSWKSVDRRALLLTFARSRALGKGLVNLQSPFLLLVERQTRCERRPAS